MNCWQQKKILIYNFKKIKIHLAPGGGFAARITAVE